MNVKEFCRKHNACHTGSKFALKFATMKDVWDALMRGEPDNETARCWALWIISRDGVLSKMERVELSVRFAERVKHLMKDQRSIDALEVAKRYAEGNATDEELEQAADDATHAAYAAAAAVAAVAVAAVAVAADDDADAAADAVAVAAAAGAAAVAADAAAAVAAYDAERAAQLEILRSLPNPFAELKNNIV